MILQKRWESNNNRVKYWIKILKRDSSVDSQEALQELSQIESDIIGSYADVESDIREIPIINDDEDYWL